nr:hypothetical protein [Arthrobacter ulcerisalmonis]
MHGLHGWDRQRSSAGQKIRNRLERRIENRNCLGDRGYNNLHHSGRHAIGNLNKGSGDRGNSSRRNHLVHHGNGG